MPDIAFRLALARFRHANEAAVQWRKMARETGDMQHDKIAEVCTQIAEERYAVLTAAWSIKKTLHEMATAGP